MTFAALEQCTRVVKFWIFEYIVILMQSICIQYGK